MTAGQGSGAGGGSAASAGAASPAPPPTDAKGPSDSSSESEDDLSPDKVSIPKKRARKSSDTPPRIMREKDHDASTDEEDHDLLGLADYEQPVEGGEGEEGLVVTAACIQDTKPVGCLSSAFGPCLI